MSKVPALALFFLLIFMSVPQGFAAPLSTYEDLVRAIREARAAAQARIEQAVEQEKVREAWEIGKLIEDHILLHKERADYGEQVLERLAADLGMSLTELRYMVQFVRAYPIRPPGGELSWSHYRALLSINEPKERERLAKRALEEKWPRDTLRREVGKVRAAQAARLETFPEDKPLIPLKGSLDTYQVVLAPAGEWKGKPVIDLGFSNYLSLEEFSSRRWPRRGATAFKEGDIIHVDPSSRAISTPIVITSTKSDKYDRYLADVWVGETYLNQKLIDKGLAVRVSE